MSERLPSLLFACIIPHNIAAPGALIGASNCFELPVAVAITRHWFPAAPARVLEAASP